jgi:hypothetical protein
MKQTAKLDIETLARIARMAQRVQGCEAVLRESGLLIRLRRHADAPGPAAQWQQLVPYAAIEAARNPFIMVGAVLDDAEKEMKGLLTAGSGTFDSAPP